MTPSAETPFMRKAIQAARAGIRKNQTPFGACIVRNGRVIAAAHNVVWKTTDITAHAEIHAIRLACKKLKTIDLSDCVIYSTCEPCPMCFAACHWARFKKIIYGAAIRDARNAGFNELAVSNQRLKRLGRSPVQITGGFMRRETLALFRMWQRRPGTRAY